MEDHGISSTVYPRRRQVGRQPKFRDRALSEPTAARFKQQVSAEGRMNEQPHMLKINYPYPVPDKVVSEPCHPGRSEIGYRL